MNRRDFLHATSSLGIGAGLGTLQVLGPITPVRAADLAVGPDSVRFRPEIEPVVRWIEETPRELAFEVAVKHLKKGLSYRDLLSGLFLAGIRNIKPRPVGFKFHAVMVMNSAHLLAQASALDERLLPMFWALDNFKNSQLQDIKEGDWTLRKIDESKLPDPTKAKASFTRAMDAWDSDAADLAITSLTRSSGAAETMEILWHYAVRDQRNIGHKPIFAAQSWRTLQAIGWQHAEPVLRSVVFGLLDLQGDARPVPIGPYEANTKLATTIREGWSIGKLDVDATRSLLEVMRHADPERASREAAALLNRGVAPSSIWDAVLLAGSELLMQSPGIIALHVVTSANSLHFIYGAAGNDTTRKLALLQAVGWIPLYRDRIKPTSNLKIDQLPVEEPKPGVEGIAELFLESAKDRAALGRRALGYISGGGTPEDLFAGLRRMIFQKGRDSHDYKYGAAVWEEASLVGARLWQGPLAAASLYQLPVGSTSDSPLMTRAREAVASVMR